MGCDKVQAPEAPKIDTSKLPEGVSFPRGQDADAFASVSDAKAGISNALKGAENLIKDNVKAMGEALNPEAIGNKIGQAVGGIAGQIKDTVTSAVDGINGLAASLKDLGNKKPEMSQVSKPGASSLGLASLSQKNKCEEKYIQKASRFNSGVKSKAANKANNLSEKEKRDMAADPEKDKQVKEKIEAEVAAETQEETAKEASKEDKEDRSTQENLQSELLAVAPKQEKCDLNYLSHLLTQMSYYQTKMYSALRSCRFATEALVTAALSPERYNTAPVNSAWALMHAGIAINVYGKLSKALVTKWDENCTEFKPAEGEFFGTAGAPRKFEEYMQSIRSDKYGANAKVTTHDTTKWGYKKMLLEYFEMWESASWMQNELTTSGSTKTINDKGLGGGGEGLLSINTDLARVIGDWYSLAQSIMSGGVSEFSDIARDVQYYVEVDVLPEIAEQFDQLELSQGKVFVGIDNNAGQEFQLFEKNFLVEANVNYNNMSVSNVKYISNSDTVTEEALA